MTNLLAKEILQKEEILLKETKSKLIEQLNRLKVEEVALQRYLLDNDESQVNQHSNAQILEEERFLNPSVSEETKYTDDANTLNQMPLENLKPNDAELKGQEIEEEEDDDEDQQM